MLTLNSNILKIGNKWIIPHSGTGPTPPGSYKSYVYREYITKTSSSPLTYTSSVQNLKFNGSFPNVSHIVLHAAGTDRDGDSLISSFTSGNNIDLATASGISPTLGDYIEIQFTTNGDPTTGSVTTTEGCQGFLYGINDDDEEILTAVTLGTGSAQTFDPNVVNAPDGFDYYIFQWYYQRHDNGNMQFQKLKFDGVIMIPEMARANDGTKYTRISTSDVYAYMEGDMLSAPSCGNSTSDVVAPGYGEIKFQAPSNFSSISITTWDWRVAGTIYGVMKNGYSVRIAGFNEGTGTGAIDLAFTKTKPTFDYNVTMTSNKGNVQPLPSGGSAHAVITLTYDNVPSQNVLHNIVASSGTVSTRYVTLASSDSNVSVYFDPKYNVSVTQPSNGTIGVSPSSGFTNDVVTLSNSPATHYHLGSYSIVSGTGATITNTNKLTIGTSDVVVTGSFLEDTKYSVTCTNDGNGTIAASPTSNYSGSTVTLSNTPNTGYNFDKYTLVSGTGASISGDTLTIGTSNVTVRGDFVAQTYNYLLVELMGYSNDPYWYSYNGGGTYGLKSATFNGSSVTTSNCKAGYYLSGVNRATVTTDDINALAYTGNYNTSPFFWGDRYDFDYGDTLTRTYILVGTGTAITSGTISFQDLLYNTTIYGQDVGKGVTITSRLYGVPASAVYTYGTITTVAINSCTLLNTGTHTAKYITIGSSETLNTTTLSYGV